MDLEGFAALDALGVLSEEEAQTWRAHLASNAGAQTVAIEFREAAAGLARDLEPLAPPPEMRARVVAAVAGQLGLIRSNEGPWLDVSAGIRVKKLSSDRARKTVTLLFEAKPGARYGDHDHRGAEDTFVVSGTCRIGERLLRAGDFLHVGSGQRHGDVSTEDGCVLLIVADYADFAAA